MFVRQRSSKEDVSWSLGISLSASYPLLPCSIFFSKIEDLLQKHTSQYAVSKGTFGGDFKEIFGAIHRPQLPLVRSRYLHEYTGSSAMHWPFCTNTQIHSSIHTNTNAQLMGPSPLLVSSLQCNLHHCCGSKIRWVNSNKPFQNTNTNTAYGIVGAAKSGGGYGNKPFQNRCAADKIEIRWECKLTATKPPKIFRNEQFWFVY